MSAKKTNLTLVRVSAVKTLFSLANFRLKRNTVTSAIDILTRYLLCF